jgi:tetratricopeptide (TPR) repeat protein
MLLCCRCVLELHAIACKNEEGGGRFAVAMTATEHQRFLKNISTDAKRYYIMLGSVNAETSDCSRAEDRESIHAGIRETVGFVKLSRMVFGVMEGWMEETIRRQLAACTATLEKQNAIVWRSVLAEVYHEQGRNLEAVELYEEILEEQKFWEDCEGVNWNLDDALVANLAVLYQSIGRHQDALRLFEKSFEFRSRTLPEMDPELGYQHMYCQLFF